MTFETMTRNDGIKFTRINIPGERDHAARLVKEKQKFVRDRDAALAALPVASFDANRPTCKGLIAQYGGNLPD